MRAEQVFEVVSNIVEDFARHGVAEKLNALISSLENQINSPSAETQNAVREQREALLETLSESRFLKYPVALQATLDEMDVKQFLGASLAQDIRLAFEGNDITPAAALEGLTSAKENTDTLLARAKSYIESSEFFEIGDDEPEDEEFELSIIIPRDAVDNELDQFGKELIKLDRLFSVFSELATGSREDFKIKAISSTDLTILLHTTPAIALLIVTALERIAAFYERLLNIITLQRGLKQTKAPDSVLEPMRKFIEKTIKDELEAAAKELEKKYIRKAEQTRRHELKTELRNALKEISARYDNGYLFDVRGNETDLVEEPDADQPQDEKKATRRIVAEKRQRLKFFRPEDGPILGLPKPTGEEPAN